MLEPGRDLDVEIGKKIIKVMIVLDNDQQYKVVSTKTKIPGLLPFYSTHLPHAHMLVNFLQHQGYFCKLGSETINGDLQFYCKFFKENQEEDITYGITMPHAIALAALKTI